MALKSIDESSFFRWTNGYFLEGLSDTPKKSAWLAHPNWIPLDHIWLVVYLPLWKMLEFVSWDDDIPNWMESQKNHVPNHQPDIISHSRCVYPKRFNPWLQFLAQPPIPPLKVIISFLGLKMTKKNRNQIYIYTRHTYPHLIHIKWCPIDCQVGYITTR